MNLALAGFLTIGSFLALILILRMPVLVALILVPMVSAVLCGFGDGLTTMSIEGLKIVAPIAVMMTFAILYFGLMIDAGLFEPLVRTLTAFVHHDPVRLCIITALLPLLVSLDGDGATTFLISVTALLPVHRRLGLNPLVLPTIVGLSAGVMNLLPWGGPTARAMAVLKTDVSHLFVPVLPAMLAGICWIFCAAFLMGVQERRRLRAAGLIASTPGGPGPDLPAPAAKSPIFWFNLALTLTLLLLLFQGLYADLVSVPPIPAPLLFILAFAIALPVNRRSAEAQSAQLSAYAASVVTVISMIFAAGIFTGILNGTGMIAAMASVLAGGVPASVAPWLSQIVAITSMPMSLVFTPDAYYFGMLPVFAETAKVVGSDPLTIGRAALMGQMTTGFPLSPLTASTYILIGLSGVSLREHQLHMFRWAFGTTLVMTIVATLTGAI
ncbi:CitMHS family transporter [Sphingobium boeckii]|uniref:CitMHS family citrate-Mg2+:H+ or citrate-Ca2+:H+ symporter n=1 Tax=Sphingobium boeckii TaxID=1082345 RepID=A0A7W9EE90_9SPHN|nr:citrate:proton symporter [Sphingobium boeckii]MBB5684755.1 CitMHS family citrate-Mg2+:H+ or citrate-Ca2+:H+ symporter [Sphingobium boeckii]